MIKFERYVQTPTADMLLLHNIIWYLRHRQDKTVKDALLHNVSDPWERSPEVMHYVDMKVWMHKCGISADMVNTYGVFWSWANQNVSYACQL